MVLKWIPNALLAGLVVAVVVGVDALVRPELDEPLGLRLLRRWAEHPLRIAGASALLVEALRARRRADRTSETAPEGNPEPPRA